MSYMNADVRIVAFWQLIASPSLFLEGSGPAEHVRSSDSIRRIQRNLHRSCPVMEAVLAANAFRWTGVSYKQGKGLAMGCRIAPSLATAFMYDVEAIALCSFPTLCERYIDDTLIIASNDEKLLRIFNQLKNACKSFCPTMKMTEMAFCHFSTMPFFWRKISWRRTGTESLPRKKIIIHPVMVKINILRGLTSRHFLQTLSKMEVAELRASSNKETDNMLLRKLEL